VSNVLELAAVSKAFGRHRVLKQAWLHVRRGEIVGLVGANGAGKTTLLRIAAGLMCADQGTVRWDCWPPRIRHFGGESTLPTHVAAHRWAGFFDVRSDERRHIGALSRGTRQHLGLTIALHGPAPDLLLLDEPWDGLDPPAALRLTAGIRDWGAAGTAIVISSHRLHDLDDVTTRFVLLEEGRCRNVPEQDRVAVERIAELVARGSRAADPPRLTRSP
jgi:ABC-2 type transport system ATP-binding protein